MKNRSRGPLAVAVAFMFLVPSFRSTRADEPRPGGACVLGEPAPKTSTRLWWRASPEDEGTPGFWLPDEVLLRAASRLNACADGWSKCQVDLSVEKGKRFTPTWKVWAITVGLGIAAGAALGFVAGR